MFARHYDQQTYKSDVERVGHFPAEERSGGWCVSAGSYQWYSSLRSNLYPVRRYYIISFWTRHPSSNFWITFCRPNLCKPIAFIECMHCSHPILVLAYARACACVRSADLNCVYNILVSAQRLLLPSVIPHFQFVHPNKGTSIQPINHSHNRILLLIIQLKTNAFHASSVHCLE